MTASRPVLLKRCLDVPGDWVAICLDNDVMSQGRDKNHALEMLREAVELCRVSDAELAKDDGVVIVRAPAPEEFRLEWERARLNGDTLDTIATVL